MFRIATTPEDLLTGKAKELFAQFPPQLGAPQPLKLMTASPGLLEVHAGVIGYFRGHKALSFPVLAAIRYLAARQFQAEACIDFNGRLLRLAGLSEAEMDALVKDPASAPFEPREQALLAFVVEALSVPPSDAALDAMRGHGWTDADILDAMAQAANMQVPALLMRTFKR